VILVLIFGDEHDGQKEWDDDSECPSTQEVPQLVQSAPECPQDDGGASIRQGRVNP